MELDAAVARETEDDAKLNLVKLELQSLEHVRKALEELTTKKLREDLTQDVKTMPTSRQSFGPSSAAARST